MQTLPPPSWWIFKGAVASITLRVMTAANRRYSDKEMALILRRAVELQSHEAGDGDAAGHSLEQIQQIASEVGIDPVLVSEAASAVERPRRGGARGILGPPTTYQDERTVGRVWSKEDATDLIEVIRRVMPRAGRVSEVADSLEWRDATDFGTTVVTVTAKRGQTRLIANGRYGLGAGFVYLFGGLAGLIGGLLAGVPAGSAQAGLGVAGGVLLVGVLAARAIWSRMARGSEGRLREVVDALAGYLESADS